MGAAPAGVLLFGEEAMAFFSMLRAAYAAPPTYLRRALKRSEDWWHHRLEPPVATGPSLPHLLRSVDVRVTGGDFGLQHHVVSSGDPGEVHFRPSSTECGPSTHAAAHGCNLITELQSMWHMLSHEVCVVLKANW